METTVGSPESTGFQQSTGESRDRLRREYRPVDVRILFVGEAPPASGLFFYAANSGLYRAVREAFVHSLPEIHEDEFLRCFQILGCYLVDLCGVPVDRLDNKARTTFCSKGEEQLAEIIRELKPQVVISVLRSIRSNVSRACAMAAFRGEHVNLPFPGRWVHHRAKFEQELAPILQREFGDTKSC